MEPFFFGSSDVPLYGVYHPAQGPVDHGHPIIICSSIGQEYMRSHRALRQLANLLNRQGFPVFRFDYRGCGDSGGDCEQFTVADWVEDVKAGAAEACELLDATECSLVGLRLGGLLACLAAPDIDGIKNVVLWDGIADGAAYKAEILRLIESSNESLANFVSDDGGLHYNGFFLSGKCVSDIEAINLENGYPRPADVYQVVSSDTALNRRLQEAWKSNPGYRYRYVEAPGDWNSVDSFGGILLPQPVIQSIVTFFSERFASCTNE